VVEIVPRLVHSDLPVAVLDDGGARVGLVSRIDVLAVIAGEEA
jgi:CBS-domain-containing membrane protein